MILGFDISTSITGVTIVDNDGQIVHTEYWDLKKHTYISKVGIYDKNKNLIAVAKVATPVKKTEEREYTFKLKLDI